METEFDIIRRFTQAYPVDVEGLAGALVYRLRRVKLPDDISGKLRRVTLINWRTGAASEGFEIQINSNHGENRARFTIAHEIAHYILHRDLIDSEVVDNEWLRSELFTGTKYETQANALAADILMPKGLIQTRYGELAGTNIAIDEIITRMAQDFGVSDQAMRIRLKVVLGLPI